PRKQHLFNPDDGARHQRNPQRQHRGRDGRAVKIRFSRHAMPDKIVQEVRNGIISAYDHVDFCRHQDEADKTASQIRFSGLHPSHESEDPLSQIIVPLGIHAEKERKSDVYDQYDPEKPKGPTELHVRHVEGHFTISLCGLHPRFPPPSVEYTDADEKLIRFQSPAVPLPEADSPKASRTPSPATSRPAAPYGAPASRR